MNINEQGKTKETRAVSKRGDEQREIKAGMNERQQLTQKANQI